MEGERLAWDRSRKKAQNGRDEEAVTSKSRAWGAQARRLRDRSVAGALKRKRACRGLRAGLAKKAEGRRRD
ncbi:hypothetical protein MRX96_035812 [Rhipicephalus microplus]